MQNLLDEALHLRSEGRLEEARDLLVRLVEAYPDHPEIRAHAVFVHDALGLEREAIPHYEAALRLGLAGPLLADVFLGLGSTWRCLGEYEKARAILEQGVERFPEDRALQVFLAMTLHNLGESARAMEILLVQLGETSNDPRLSQYRKTILFYSDKLDLIF